MTAIEKKILQLITSNKSMREVLSAYGENPSEQNYIIEEIELNERIIKFLENERQTN